MLECVERTQNVRGLGYVDFVNGVHECMEKVPFIPEEVSFLFGIEE